MQLTKAQLVAALEQSHVSYQRLEAECARLREHVAAKAYVRPDVRNASDFKAKCELARREAMLSGRVTKVG